MIHSFEESLKDSHAASGLPLWEECYRKFFLDFRSMTDHRENGHWQDKGIDRSITLISSKQILVDEKARKKAYPCKHDKTKYDIALEYISNDKYNTPGWVCKPLMADYIAYAIKPVGKCYLLPVIQLQQAWLKNEQEWRYSGKYFQSPGKNEHYTSWSACIPENILFKEIGACLRCDFTIPI